MKITKKGYEAKKAIRDGIIKAAEIISYTLGPSSNTVVIDKGFGYPILSDDGVTVAKELEFEDKFENIGASLLDEIASKTNQEVGDGTTTAVVLARSMLEKSFDTLATNMAKGAFIKKGIEDAVHVVIQELDRIKKVITPEDIEKIATISSLDPIVGHMISGIFKEIGNDGIVSIEQSQGIGVESEIVQGSRIDTGWKGYAFVNDLEKMETSFEDTHVLFSDKALTTEEDMVTVMNVAAATGKKWLVIVGNVIGDALNLAIHNSQKKVFQILCIDAPLTGELRTDLLKDLAIIMGGRVVGEHDEWSAVSLKDLGQARKVVATRTTTTFIEGKGSKEAVEQRAKELKGRLDSESSGFNKDKLIVRIARLISGIGIIKVGGITETEARSKKFKIEDAVNAVKAAISEGIVLGGGAALIHTKKALNNALDSVEGDTRLGYEVVLNSLDAPFRQIASNMGVNADDLLKEIESGKGYDFVNLKFVDIDSGVIDPVKVEKLALQNAASVISTLITAQAIIAIKPEVEKEK